uniref:Protein HTATIP2 n=1 Tax=Acrobeloides nanus TaxID=290746 RepID=A0A914DTX6_9BILA
MAATDFSVREYSYDDVNGYTGEVGKQLTKELLKKNIFARVVLIGRRKVDLGADATSANAEQVQIDFDAVDQHKAVFSGSSVGFCCLGTTRAKSGKDGFIKVDHDYVLNVAKVAKESGCEQFHLLTSTGANKNSFFLYPKTKGLVEEHVEELKFPKLFIYRPGMLLSEREESRIGERIGKFLLTPIFMLCPTWISAPIETVAKAMLANLWNKPKAENGVEIVNNAEIHKLGGDYEKMFEQK